MRKLLAGIVSFAIVFSFSSVVKADVNDFTITDYQMDLWLGKDEEGRSTLRTKEVITALFPDIDQNHGIERAIPNKYDDHSTHLMVDFSLGNDGDATNNTTTYVSNNNTVVRFGSADTYVHGTKTYSLSYMQRDVTKFYEDPTYRADEFYWDTNGTEWRVPIEKLAVRVHVDESIRNKLNGSAHCYGGEVGLAVMCSVDYADGTFTITASNLQPGDNRTIALGFEPGTFAGYQPSLWEKLVGYWLISLIITGVLSVIIGTWMIIRWVRAKNRTKEVGTIVPEYIPPLDMSVTAAAEVIDLPRGTMTAQIIDLAVRHYLKVYETREKSTFKKAEYDLEIVKPIDDLKWEEQELIRDLFAGTVDVGTRMSMKSLQNSTAFHGRIQNNAPALTKKIRGDYGLREKHQESSRWFKRAGWTLFGMSLFTLSPFLFVDAILSFILGAVLWRLSDKGLDLRRYLLGLKEYISVAETERIRMLQSPDGAAKAGETIDPANQSQLIKLYERVLPYAVLFGQEKQWNKQLGQYYESAGSQPDWYQGASGFHAANFATAMNSFSTSTHYASPSNSSSSGSGGGGFSGGGGGGGGGGGW
jgi:uncharacterized membrane protein YgcG